MKEESASSVRDAISSLSDPLAVAPVHSRHTFPFDKDKMKENHDLVLDFLHGTLSVASWIAFNQNGPLTLLRPIWTRWQSALRLVALDTATQLGHGLAAVVVRVSISGSPTDFM